MALTEICVWHTFGILGEGVSQTRVNRAQTACFIYDSFEAIGDFPKPKDCTGLLYVYLFITQRAVVSGDVIAGASRLERHIYHDRWCDAQMCVYVYGGACRLSMPILPYLKQT